eukprot:3738880-Alexandrium_andersonii.AAC.1
MAAPRPPAKCVSGTSIRRMPHRPIAARTAGATSTSTASRGPSRTMFKSPTRWPAVRRAGRPANWVATARLSSGGIYATRMVHWAKAAASGLCPGPLRSN